MKKFLIIFSILLGGACASNSFGQEVCDSLVGICSDYMKISDDGSLYVSDGQTHQTLLDGEPAEFQTTFFGGSTYRIAATAGTKENYVIFTIYDLNGKVLFTNSKYKNAPYWDFQVTSTIPCRIEAKLDEDLKVSGCIALMIGFKK
jgi:hypothetical protein